MAFQPPGYGFGAYISTYPYGQVPFDFQQPNDLPIASGNIYPFRFVSISGSGMVAQSVRGDWPIGISPQNTAVWNSDYAATQGYPLETYNNGQDCWLMLGADVQAGQMLKPDDVGCGIPALSGDPSGAKAYENGSSGNLICVRVLRLAPLVRSCYSDWSAEYSYEFGNDCQGV
jgi:hypothetical protein